MITLETDVDLCHAGADLVHRLGGRWHDGGGMCLCPAHDDHRPSLSIRVGERALLFKCFAGCTAQEIFAALRGLRVTLPSRVARAQATEPAPNLRGAAQALWCDTLPIPGTIAETYLGRRTLMPGPLDLRFHPRTPIGRGHAVRFRPALIAAIREGRHLVAVQRTFLDADGFKARDLLKSKLCLGRPLGGAVQLYPVRHILGLAEGYESAMSAARRLNIPVWATLGAERFNHIVIPDSVTHLILLADTDRAGHRAAAKAAFAYARPGRVIEAIWAPSPHNDWNDLDRAEGKGGGMGCGRRA